MAALSFWLTDRHALGDTLTLSGIPRDLAAAHPGKYKLWCDTNFMAIWAHNPWVQPPQPYESIRPQPLKIKLTYGDGIRAAERAQADPKRYAPLHFLPFMHKKFREVTGLEVPCLRPRGDLHLTEMERRPLLAGRYWALVAGGKRDATVKFWTREGWQAVADGLGAMGLDAVQVGGASGDHHHYALERTTNLVGKTESLRDLFSLIYGAEGVVCGITGPMHVAAALEKPCVVLAGGRESPVWEWYGPGPHFGPQCEPIRIPHRYLHTIGRPEFPCCAAKGCWKSRVVPVAPYSKNNRHNRSPCLLPVKVGQREEPLAACMVWLKPERVLEAVWSYYLDGTLPPLGPENPPCATISLAS